MCMAVYAHLRVLLISHYMYTQSTLRVHSEYTQSHERCAHFNELTMYHAECVTMVWSTWLRRVGSAQICRQFFGQNIDNFHEKNCSAKFEQNIEEFWKFMRFVWGIVEFPGCFDEYWKISSPWVTWVAVKNHRWLLGRHYSKSKCQSRSKFEQSIGSVPALPSKLSTRPKQNFAAKYR